jgi:hypothetical protein
MCRLQVLAGMTLVLLLLLQADCARHCCNATSSKLVDEMHPAIKTQALAELFPRTVLLSCSACMPSA